MNFRTLLAAVLGVGLGLVFVAFPATVVRIQTAGRRPSGRGGEYGTDTVGSRWRRVVQVVGVALVAVGLYFGASVV
jgi:hypothetical protein